MFSPESSRSALSHETPIVVAGDTENDAIDDIVVICFELPTVFVCGGIDWNDGTAFIAAVRPLRLKEASANRYEHSGSLFCHDVLRKSRVG